MALNISSSSCMFGQGRVRVHGLVCATPSRRVFFATHDLSQESVVMQPNTASCMCMRTLTLVQNFAHDKDPKTILNRLPCRT